MNRTTFKYFLCCTAILFITILAAYETPKGWTTNAEAAWERSAKSGKNVLLLFTGSDWCYYCIQLRAQVLETPEFLKFAKEKFELVYIDFPKKTELPSEIRQRNSSLQKKYQVDGFPCTVITDSNGIELGRVGGFTEKYTEAIQNAMVKDTPLNTAVIHGDIQEVTKLAADASAINKPGKGRFTPLHVAILRRRDAEIAKILIQNGANVNITYQGLPLLAAAIYQKMPVELIKLMIDKKADVNAVIPGKNITALHFCAAYGTPEIYNMLVNAGANPKSVDSEKNTLLHAAVLAQNIPMIRHLIKCGADVTAKDAEKHTPADVAATDEIRNILSKPVPFSK